MGVRGTRVKGQGSRDKGQGTRDKGQGTRDKGQGTRDKRQGLRGVEKKIIISIKSVDDAKVRLRVSEKVGGNKKFW